jgi:hypothetical protein
LCEDLLSVDDPWQSYVKFASHFAEEVGYGPDAYSFATANELTPGSAEAETRAFFYQQCTEIGLFQTANKDAKMSVRSQRLNAAYMKKGCERLFGAGLTTRVDAFRERYYKPTQIPSSLTKVFYTDGSLDPFGVAGVLKTTNSKLQTYLIAGGSHCDDLTYDYIPTESHQKAHDKALAFMMRVTK